MPLVRQLRRSLSPVLLRADPVCAIERAAEDARPRRCDRLRLARIERAVGELHPAAVPRFPAIDKARDDLAGFGIEQLGNQLIWQTRIFEDRRRVIKFVCEVPVAIDQRLFALGRMIQQGME